MKYEQMKYVYLFTAKLADRAPVNALLVNVVENSVGIQPS